MTSVDTVIGPRTAGSRRLLPLIGKEARRLARHPVLWLAPALVILTTALETPSSGRSAAYWSGTIFVAVTFFGPLIVLFAANLVASGARRGHAEETLSVTPMTDTRRTWATCLGIALPLAATGGVAATAMALIQAVNDIPPDQLRPAGELAQLPFVLGGAGLLGFLAARWLPFTGGVLMTFIAATLGGIIVFRRFDTGVWWMWWTTDTTPDTAFNDLPPGPGSPWLHAAYLAGLCTCAAVAATYRDRSQWRRLALVGGPVLAATLTLGWLQLP
jgi:hypothetical protein